MELIPMWLIDTCLNITYFGLIMVGVVIIFFANERRRGYPKGKEKLVNDGIINLLKNYHVTVLLGEILLLYKYIYYTFYS